MAFIQTQTTNQNSIFDRPQHLLLALVSRYKKYKLFKRTVSELRELSGRELSDLGISRSTIVTVALEAVYK
jgi:uncharacterized protein YjiS (DUF1127 family)